MEPGQLLINEWLMIICFCAGMIFWGFYTRKRAAESLSATFLAGRKVPGFVASLSTVATNLNANDFIGMAGAVYGVGIVLFHGQMINALVLAFLGVALMKKLRGRNAYSLGQWLKERYSAATGNAYSIIWAFVWMLFNLGLYIYAGALVMHTLVGWNLYAGIIILSLIAAIYTLLGGFGAVVATDVIQILLMFFPLAIMAIIVWQVVGGPFELLQAVPAEKSALWNSATPFGPLGMAIAGMVFLSMSYWSTEAQVVQRPLSARNPDEAAISYLGASFWYALLVPFVIFLPALAAIQLFPDLPNNDFAAPMLIKTFIPPGLYGVTIVGLLAGTFSSCDSQINAFCTIFTNDIYKGMIRKDADTAHYLRVSKIAGAIFTLAAIGTAIVFSFAKDGMFLFAVGILATIMPPFGAIVISGALWRRASPRAANISLIAGMLLAVTLFGLDLFGELSTIAGDTLFLRAAATFLFTFICLAGISLFDQYSDSDSKTPQEESATSARQTRNILVMALITIVIALYVFFSMASFS